MPGRVTTYDDDDDGLSYTRRVSISSVEKTCLEESRHTMMTTTASVIREECLYLLLRKHAWKSHDIR